MSDGSKNDFSAVAVSLLIAAITWILTTIWTEYSRSNIITFDRRTSGAHTVFRIRNESFLQSATDVKFSFVCPKKPDCFSYTNASAKSFATATLYPPLAPASIDVDASSNARSVVVILSMTPRTQVDIGLMVLAEPNRRKPDVDLYYMPDDQKNSTLVIESGILTWLLGNFPLILFVLGSVACVLLAAVLLPALASIWRRDKNGT